ncbi:MAG: DUF4430 domain-containing protein [Oscillospiraceae bacterium]
MTISKNKKGIIIILSLLLVMIGVVVFSVVYSKTKTQPGFKKITVEVCISPTEKKTFKIETDEEFLGNALIKEKIITVRQEELGMFITSANGRLVNEANQEWWSITKKGEMLTTGVDSTPMAHGDKFEITLKRGYK